MKQTTRLLSSALVVACLALPARAVLVGQTDTFEDGTTQGWIVGDPSHPSPPANVASGGPAGADDNYLQITSLGGFGAGSRLSAFNLAQWAGDYTAAGIGSITMDVRNSGPDDIYLRLLLADPFAGPPSNVAISNAVYLPAGGGWTPAAFAVDAASLTAVLGSADSALSNATELRLFHNQNPVFAGPPTGSPPITAVLGIDNVRAAGVIPEPSSMALLGLGFSALLARRRRARG